MAKSTKGPRIIVGLKCSDCGTFNYITTINKLNERLKKQTTGEKTFPLKKYCPKCRKHTVHKMVKKLK